MLNIDYTNESVFGFDGYSLCFLGNEEDFLNLSNAIIDLTGENGITLSLKELNFVNMNNQTIGINFISRKDSKNFGCFKNDLLIFELDFQIWNRIFKYFVIMSRKKTTYYLNEYENCLVDLNLEQEFNFICSSEF
jgi:hypothetical protein